ncbi:FI04781p [Strongyloides ratti]|uniref:Nucleolar protein 56 n=1 Tax=Strongyloides ratti TaxID=34506 RepID=A0A090LQ23_STRRB|nr:FI04781p [Strongyloides ratti]CEF70244.1 FI04781p [Strongyloides ratti]
MSEAPNFVLFEHALGYVLFRVKEFEDIGMALPQVQEAILDPKKFMSIINVEAFDPFKNTEAALDNCNAISEGICHPDLVTFLEANLPKKKSKVTLGCGDNRLAGSLVEQFPKMKVMFTGIVPEIIRGIRFHIEKLLKDIPHFSLAKAQLSLGHSYSRSKVKFDVHRVDNMVIQSIALLDTLDKDINLFAMRIREWYSYHFPELYKIVSEQTKFIKCANIIMDRKNYSDDTVAKLLEVLNDEEKVNEITDAVRASMGMEISELDLMNITRFTARVNSLLEYRAGLHQYIKDRMSSCAPSLSALIGEQVGARLISHAGSLTNLAKYPASTIQILGAEKALFRALKTRSKTPKFGLIFHSSFIGKAAAKDKGKISRFLANKCSIASRIDCFSDVPVSTFGEKLKEQVEERLKFFEIGEKPRKNLEVMEEAMTEAQPVIEKVLKRKRKAEKKAKKAAAAALADESFDTTAASVEDTPKKKKKKVEA